MANVTPSSFPAMIAFHISPSDSRTSSFLDAAAPPLLFMPTTECLWRVRTFLLPPRQITCYFAIDSAIRVSFSASLKQQILFLYLMIEQIYERRCQRCRLDANRCASRHYRPQYYAMPFSFYDTPSFLHTPPGRLPFPPAACARQASRRLYFGHIGSLRDDTWALLYCFIIIYFRCTSAYQTTILRSRPRPSPQGAPTIITFTMPRVPTSASRPLRALLASATRAHDFRARRASSPSEKDISRRRGLSRTSRRFEAFFQRAFTATQGEYQRRDDSAFMQLP